MLDSAATTSPVEANPIPHEQEAALLLPLGLLTPSPTNPRKTFDKAGLDELATSIKQLGGVFQPILARPNPAFTESNGHHVDSSSEAWRHECEARYIANLPSREARLAYIEGVSKRRSEAAGQALQALATTIYTASRKASKP